MMSRHSSPFGAFSFSLIAMFALSATMRAQIGPPPKTLPPRQGPTQTALGYLIRAEITRGTQITFPAPHDRLGRKEGIERNGPVASAKGKSLLVLHFEVTRSQCLRLDRDVLLVKSGETDRKGEGSGGGKVYRYGGWWVDDAQYSICDTSEPPRPVVGPWVNSFWDPVAIRPQMGQFRLVFEIDPDAKNLTLTDGRVVIDLDALLKK